MNLQHFCTYSQGCYNPDFYFSNKICVSFEENFGCHQVGGKIWESTKALHQYSWNGKNYTLLGQKTNSVFGLKLLQCTRSIIKTKNYIHLTLYMVIIVFHVQCCIYEKRIGLILEIFLVISLRRILSKLVILLLLLLMLLWLHHYLTLIFPFFFSILLGA